MVRISGRGLVSAPAATHLGMTQVAEMIGNTTFSEGVLGGTGTVPLIGGTGAKRPEKIRSGSGAEHPGYILTGGTGAKRPGEKAGAASNRGHEGEAPRDRGPGRSARWKGLALRRTK